MLVKVTRGAYYKRDSLFLVYAIKETDSQISYAVYPVDESNLTGLEVNPFYVQAGIFEVVEDRVTRDWKSGEFQVGGKLIYFKSFPEFFSVEGFWHRLNDLNLDESDYKIMRSYKHRYRETYGDLIRSRATVTRS